MLGLFDKIKNYVMIGMIAVIVILGGLYLWQRITVVKQKGEITKLSTENISLKEQAKTNAKNIADANALTAKYQKLQNETSKIKAEIFKLTQGRKCLEADDEKVFTYITRFFNDEWVRSDDSSDPSE
jgi:hypothetical protein